MVGISNSSLGEYGLDRGRDLAIKLGFGAVLQSEGTVVERNNPRHRARCSCTAATGYRRLGRTSFVAMMEAPDLWERDNLARSGRVYRAALPAILGVRAGLGLDSG